MHTQNGTIVNVNVTIITTGRPPNTDGSIDIFFGPDIPEGKRSNWVKTQAGDTWFTYFRLYGPTATYFDRSWPMYDIQEIK